jgi:hypothetical protein
MSNVSSGYFSPVKSSSPAKYAAKAEAIDSSKLPKAKLAPAAATMPDQPSEPAENDKPGAGPQLKKNASLDSITSTDNFKNDTDRKRSKLSSLIQLQNKESKDVENSIFAAK